MFQKSLYVFFVIIFVFSGQIFSQNDKKDIVLEDCKVTFAELEDPKVTLSGPFEDGHSSVIFAAELRLYKSVFPEE